MNTEEVDIYIQGLKLRRITKKLLKANEILNDVIKDFISL